MIIGDKIFENGTHIMGILNVTPDSFSDGGKWNNIDAALSHTEEMIRDGAAVIDIGGESTRPGYTRISDDEEIARVVPVIEAVKSRFDVPVSVDTYKSAVAEAALSAGADLLNDIWGFKADSKIAAVCRKYDAACCLMHNRTNKSYGSFFEDVLKDLRESILIAKAAGIEDDKICTDPGVGFAKSLEQNLAITQNVDLLGTLGYPVLLGTSRKSMIGLTLDLDRDNRVEGTLVTTVTAVMKGCLFVRVHDVRENYRAIKMAQALKSFERK
ncbi:MAG: dihydropteroate synthase [bacterium]|nr:dihydropteroate synthase [bacterium]